VVGCVQLLATTDQSLLKTSSQPSSVSRVCRQWLTLIERQITKAQKTGQLPTAPSAPALAFEIDALLAAANVARNLYDDERALTMAKSLIEFRLGGQTKP
jgi:hypothetical protein